MTYGHCGMLKNNVLVSEATAERSSHAYRLSPNTAVQLSELCMRGLFILSTFLLLVLQYPLWFGNNSLPDAWKLQAKIELQIQRNLALAERNRLLDAEVLNLKKGLDVVEEKARYELGMIKKGETFYQIIEPAKAQNE